MEVLRQLLLWECQIGCSRGTEDGVAKRPGTITLRSLLTRSFLYHSLSCNTSLFAPSLGHICLVHCMLGTLNLCMCTFPCALCFIQLHGSAWHGYQLCVRSVVFRWLRHEKSGKRFSHTHLGVWVLVCGG